MDHAPPSASGGNAPPSATCEARTAKGTGCTYRARGGASDGRRLCGVHLRCSVGVLTECPICLDGIETRRSGTTLSCNHTFHTRCLRPWFRTRPLTCPMCRAMCLEGMALLGGNRMAPKLQALVRTVPPPPRSFFPAYILAQLESAVVREALGCDKSVIELLVDVACECFTKNNFFTKIRNMQL